MDDRNDGDVLVNKQYGKWNAIFVQSNTNEYVFYQNHSKLFPEQLEDWIESIKRAHLSKEISPIRLDIDITNSCSNNCCMCFAKELRTNIPSMIKLEQLKNIFFNFKSLGGKSVRLTGGGDPLNHPNIIEIITYLGELGLKITIETNGDLLSPAIISAIAKYVHHLRVSFDAGDDESRKKVHRPYLKQFTYDNLISKIITTHQTAIKFKREHELFIGATFVILPENFLTVGKFITDMYEIGINWVAIRKNIYRKVYEDNPNIIPFVETTLKKLRGKLTMVDKDFTIEEQYGVSFDPKSDFNTCWVSYVRLIVLANASLQLCCLTRNGMVSEANLGILQHMDKPLDALLDNNEKNIDTFRQVVPKQCQLCIDRDNNISFSNIAALLDKDVDCKFSKAKVFLKGSNEKNYFNDCQIIQLPLDEQQYDVFRKGLIVTLEGDQSISR